MCWILIKDAYSLRIYVIELYLINLKSGSGSELKCFYLPIYFVKHKGMVGSVTLATDCFKSTFTRNLSSEW